MHRIVRIGLPLLMAGLISLLGSWLPAYGKTVEGTLVSMDAGVLVIRGMDGQEVEYSLGAGVTVPAGVQSGSRVELTVAEDAYGSTITGVALAAGTDASPGRSTQAAADPQAGSAPMSASQEVEDMLPETASPTWALGLLGVALLAGGLALGRRRPAPSRTYFKVSRPH